MEQEAIAPKTLPSHVSVGIANLVREEPMVAFPRWTLCPVSVARPETPATSPRTFPSRNKGEAGPLQLRGAGRGFSFPSSFT